MTGKRVASSGALPAFRMSCKHRIPIDARRFIAVWQADVHVFCNTCGEFRKVSVIREAQGVALTTLPML